MHKLAVIGTAGRGTDKERMSKELYKEMYNELQRVVAEQKPRVLVSGGAAWADHLAISYFLSHHEEIALELHLPAQYDGAKFFGSKDAETANYYHKLFSDKVGANTLLGIEKAREKGAIIKCYNGFKTRNREVAKADGILAFTFGTHNYIGSMLPALSAGLKDGGTAHTWDVSKATWRRHYCLR